MFAQPEETITEVVHFSASLCRFLEVHRSKSDAVLVAKFTEMWLSHKGWTMAHDLENPDAAPLLQISHAHPIWCGYWHTGVKTCTCNTLKRGEAGGPPPLRGSGDPV